MESTTLKRGGAAHDAHRSQKRARTNGNDAPSSSGPGSTFASRMMAKMGYQKGQGLGREGTGIINPIEVKLRPQGAGVGAVKEKTAQAKAEAKRQAEQKGEQYEDSSEEEKSARRRRKNVGTPLSSGRQTPIGRPKQKVRTVAEIEVEEGLVVPNVFKNLIDHTGQQPKLLTSTAGLLVTPTIGDQTELNKIAIYARRELDAFVGTSRTLRERKQYAELQADELRKDIERQEAETLNMRSVADAINAVNLLSDHSASSVISHTELETELEMMTTKLEEIQLKFADNLERFDMYELAVAALQPLFKKLISAWHPLEEPLGMVPYLQRLRAILGIDHGSDDVKELDDPVVPRSRVLTTPYESLILTQWLPKIRTLIVNEWDPSDPSPLLLLMGAWKDVLPSQVYFTLLNQLIVQRLSDAVKTWKPHSSVSKHKSALHLMIFPWLERLDEYHRDPRSSTGLLAEIKRRFRTAFSTWDPSKGVIAGLDEWLKVDVREFRSELIRALEMQLLPALARYLHDRLDVDPGDQDITPIEKVLQWSPIFSAEKFSRVLIDAFFPKWMNVLHLWLTSEPNYEEIGQWYTWWQSQFPDAINAIGAVAAEWDAGLDMMNRAMDLGPDRVKTELAQPKAGPRRPVADDISLVNKTALTKEKKPASGGRQAEDISFKDLLEELCEREGLLMLPLRKAHAKNGLPLWKITASASGSGGVTFYIKGDVMFAQNKKEKEEWQPVDPFAEGALATLAEVR